MIKTFLLLLTLSLIGANIGAQPIDVIHLKLQLNFDETKKQTAGVAELTLTMLKPSHKITLDAGFLNITKVTHNNQKLVFVNPQNDLPKNFEITLDKMYHPQDTIILVIHYNSTYENRTDPFAISGSFGKGLRFQKPTFTTPAKRKQIWSSGEPDGNKYWFPGHEDLSDFHTTEIMATVEKPLMVIATGNLQSVKDHGDNTRTYHYSSPQAYPNFLVSLVIGDYSLVEQKINNVTIKTFGYPHEKEAVKATVELLPDMLTFMEEHTEFPFPYPTYHQVVVQDYPFPGLVGAHNCALLSDNYIDDYGVHKDFKYLWDGVAMQALAAQWFGNLIMPKTWNDIWLTNAFVEYFAGLYTIKDNGPEEFLLWYYYPWEKALVSGDRHEEIKIPISPASIDSIPDYNSNNFNKFRGALILRMLQHELGDATWWKTIKYYVKTNAGRQVTTQDFQQAVEFISGKNYQWFFDQWIYGVGTPVLEVNKKYDSLKKELVLSIKQIQSQENKTLYHQIANFTGKIDLEIDGQLHSITLNPKAENRYTFHYEKEPNYVHFNVNENFLCEYTFNKNSKEYISQLANAHDLAARKLAIDQLSSIFKDSSTTSEQKAAIVETLVSQVLSAKYWRYRLYALNALNGVQPRPFTTAYLNLLTSLIKNESNWLKSTAINILGSTNDEKYLPLYQNALADPSDRVINAAAIAIGKTKSAKAYQILMNLENQKSWKNQNRISALNGLQFLEDDRAVDYILNCIKDNTSPRWYLATPVWDYPYAAVNTLVALKKEPLAYPILLDRLYKSLEDKDLNDIFQNIQLIDLLKDKRAVDMYSTLKEKFKDDLLITEAIKVYEQNYLLNLNIK